MSVHVNRVVLPASAELDTGSASNNAYVAIPFKCRLIRAQFAVRGTEATTASIEVDIVKAGTLTSAQGGTIVLPAADASYKTYYEDTGRNIILEEGDYVIADVSVASSGAKLGQFQVIVEEIPEEDENKSRLIAG
ncbi:MAG: hypothetical protein E6R03_04735 [Hyphomicrobiaceae bacterium]|nr:MAG: hypothetical protein E6R03_04735 [Hyphomicrobiaceae bacterium]